MCYSCTYDVYADGVLYKRVYGDDSLKTAWFLIHKDNPMATITYTKVM